MIQVLFGCGRLKQMKLQVPDDEWSTSFSSTVFETTPIKICHGYASMEQLQFLAYS
jgi:hypothetical protein